MGTVPHEVKRTPGLHPERPVPENNSLQKERSDMDSLTEALLIQLPACSPLDISGLWTGSILHRKKVTSNEFWPFGHFGRWPGTRKRPLKSKKNILSFYLFRRQHRNERNVRPSGQMARRRRRFK